MSWEPTLGAENSRKLFGRSGLHPKPRWGSSQRSPDPLAAGEGLAAPSPRTPPPLLAFGLDFQPHSAASPNSLHIPLMLRSLDKNTGSAYILSQRMHQNAGFCIEKKFPGSPRGGMGDIFSHPPPPRPHPPYTGAPPLLLGWLRPRPYEGGDIIRPMDQRCITVNVLCYTLTIYGL